MSEDERNRAGARGRGGEGGRCPQDPGIRFSESEWEEVKNAAAAHEMPAAEFVRERILALARTPKSAVPPPVPPKWRR